MGLGREAGLAGIHMVLFECDPFDKVGGSREDNLPLWAASSEGAFPLREGPARAASPVGVGYNYLHVVHGWFS